jgi:hypothetical protein
MAAWPVGSWLAADGVAVAGAGCAAAVAVAQAARQELAAWAEPHYGMKCNGAAALSSRMASMPTV